MYGKLPILINEKNVFDEKIFTGVWKLLLKLENKKFFSGDLSCDMDKSNNSNDKLKIDEKLAFNMKKKSECLFWNNKEQRISYDNRKYYFYNFFQLLSFPIQMWPLAQRTIFVETNYERIMKNNFLCMTHSGYKSKNIQEYEYMANKNKNNNVFCMINTNNKKTSSIINETLSIMISENNKKKKMKII